MTGPPVASESNDAEGVRIRRALLVIALIAAVFPPIASGVARAGVARPNILVIMTDDQRPSSLDKMPQT